MQENPKLPVVVWSCCVDEIPECLKWFADALLQKADGPDALVSAVERLVAAASTTKKPLPRLTLRTIEQLSA